MEYGISLPGRVYRAGSNTLSAETVRDLVLKPNKPVYSLPEAFAEQEKLSPDLT